MGLGLDSLYGMDSRLFMYLSNNRDVYPRITKKGGKSLLPFSFPFFVVPSVHFPCKSQGTFSFAHMPYSFTNIDIVLPRFFLHLFGVAFHIRQQVKGSFLFRICRFLSRIELGLQLLFFFWKTMQACGTCLSLDAVRLLFALELLIESAHARGADTRLSKPSFNVTLACFAGVLCGSSSEILVSLFFVFGNSCFALLASFFSWVVINICEWTHQRKGQVRYSM